MAQDAFILPWGNEFTKDPAEAAEAWAEAFHRAVDALELIRPIPERILLNKPVRNLDEILLECDGVIAMKLKW